MRLGTQIKWLAAALFTVILLQASTARMAADDTVLTAAPPPPTRVLCSDRGPFYDHIEVWVWRMAGANYEIVARSLTPDGAKTYLGMAMHIYEYVTGYDDYDVMPGQTYYYWGADCNQDGCSSWVGPKACYLEPLAPPTNVQASENLYSYVRVTYNLTASPYSAGYAIYRATSPSGTYTFVGTDTDGDGSYQDTSAPRGVLLYYKIKACTPYNQCSAFSSPVAEGYRRLAQPAWIQAGDGTMEGRVGVDWPDVPYATFYRVYRGTSAYGYNTTYSPLYETVLYDTMVSGTTHYFYWVEACNSLSCSVLVGPDEGWAGTVPPTPTNVQASDGLTTMVRVTWSASAGASYYQVWRAATEGGSYTQVQDGIAGTLWEDVSATPGVTYWYRVKACYASMCSALSSADSGYRVGPSPTPTNTARPTATRTATPITAPSMTPSPTRTNTTQPSPTRTPTCTSTPRPTETLAPGQTPSFTPTRTRTPTMTRTPTVTRTPTRTRTATATPVGTPHSGVLVPLVLRGR
jgi:fibronectin type 3 domain-containing protein